MNKLIKLTVAMFVSATSFNLQAGTLNTFTSDVNGFDTHTYYYDDGKEVTVFDTQFVGALTQAMVSQIKQTTASPITRVIITHPNPDKFNGLSVLHAMGVQSIASAATQKAMPEVHAYKKYYWVNIAKVFTEESYPKFETIQVTFSDKTTLKLKSGETITLFELKNPGVSSTQTVARIDKTGDLIVGDLVHYKAHAWLEGGIVGGAPRPDLTSWQAAVKELRSLGGRYVYAGRGETGLVKDAIKFQTEYLAWADREVSAYVATVPAEELKDPILAQAHYKKIEARFASARPDLKFPYLIGYGVYGLVNSKLK